MRAFLRQILKKTENTVSSRVYAVVAHVCLVVTNSSKRFSKPPPSATRPSLPCAVYPTEPTRFGQQPVWSTARMLERIQTAVSVIAFVWMVYWEALSMKENILVFGLAKVYSLGSENNGKA